MKYVWITDPKLPGSYSFRIVRNDDDLPPLREQIAERGCLGSEAYPVESDGTFWRIQRTMKGE